MAFRKRKGVDSEIPRLGHSIDEKKKLSLEYCKKILNQDGEKYTDEQVLQIRDKLYEFAEIEYLIFMSNKKPKEE